MVSKRQKLDLEKVDETNDEACYINALPPEIILNIFNYLTQNQLARVARVCKKWNALSKSPTLWRMVNKEILCSYDKERDTQLLKSFIDGLPSCVTFIRLNFSHRGYLNFQELCMKLHEKCPHVKVLILALCDISIDLSKVINFCTQFLQILKKLVLRDCLFLKDYSGTAELKDNSTIEVLDLNLSKFYHFRTIQFSKLLSLKELRLESTLNETSVDDSCFVGDASFLNHLQVLDLGFTDVTVSTFTAIQRHGQNLKELYLCDLPLGDRDFSFNGPVFPHLHTICLIDTDVTCEGLVSLVRSCPSLVSVYVLEDVARSFAEHPFVVANRCKSGIVKSMYWIHDHNVDYLRN